jgi:Ca2+-binding RTX toxin-like protein
MTRRLIIALTLLTVSAAVTAYAAVARQSGGHPCAGSINHCVTIPPERYPHGCHPNGVALRGLRGTQALEGTPRRDLLRGGPSGNILVGYEEGDCLFGQGGGDHIDGRGGNDWLRGGDQSDALNGGADDDRLQGDRGTDQILGRGGRDLIRGGRGSDRYKGVSGHRGRFVAAINAGSGRDLVVDTKGHNDISCGKGIDKVVTNTKSRVKNCEHVTRR